MSINTVHLLGNVGNDPELRVFDSGNVSVQLSIACNEKYTNKQGEKVEKTEWINLVGYRKVAEVIDKYVKKGDQLYVEGSLRTRSYDAKDGTKRYITEVIINKIDLISGRRENSAPPPPPENNYNPSSNQVKNNDVKPQNSHIPPEEDELPF